MGSGFENLILFGLLSLMLLIGTLLRAKVKLFQDYLPSFPRAGLK